MSTGLVAVLVLVVVFVGICGAVVFAALVMAGRSDEDIERLRRDALNRAAEKRDGPERWGGGWKKPDGRR